MIKVSFVMPTWKAAFLHEAIASIINQTYKDIELIVVDDCSPEGIKEIVDGFSDTRITYKRNETNIGGKDLVAQWNHCIEYATGDYIVLAGDDDTYSPEFTEACVSLAGKYPAVNVIRSAVEQIDGNGNHLWDDHILEEYLTKEQYLSAWFDNKAFTCMGNFMFSRKALEDIGGFIPFPCAFGTDIATPVALSVNGVANTSKMLFQFRQTDIHLSSDSSRFPEKLEAVSQLTEWFGKLDYTDKEFLHRRCIYDYFNLVIKNVPLKKLSYIRYCRLATIPDKLMMLLRWMKRRLTGALTHR